MLEVFTYRNIACLEACQGGLSQSHIIRNIYIYTYILCYTYHITCQCENLNFSEVILTFVYLSDFTYTLSVYLLQFPIVYVHHNALQTL